MRYDHLALAIVCSATFNIAGAQTALFASSSSSAGKPVPIEAFASGRQNNQPTPAASVDLKAQKSQTSSSNISNDHDGTQMVDFSCMSPKLTPAEKIQCFQAENAVLEAALKNAETKRKLDITGTGDVRNLGMPSVLATYGVGTSRTAVLSWSEGSGGALVVQVGDTIPGGWKVQSIGDGKVIVRSPAGTLSTLLLDSGVVAASQPQQQQLVPQAPNNSAQGMSQPMPQSVQKP